MTNETRPRKQNPPVAATTGGLDTTLIDPANAMSDSEERLKARALELNTMNVNVIPVNGEEPVSGATDWKQWEGKRQSRIDVKNLDFSEATGLAIINGTGDWRCIFLGGCDDQFVVDKLLEELDLPSDYQWVVRTENGFHVWLLCEEADIDDEVISGGKTNLCAEIKLRWSSDYTLIPPSSHPSGTEYTFSHENASGRPERVDAEQIIEAFSEWRYSETSIENPDLLPTKAVNIEKRPIQWIWEEYLARGVLHIVDGDPGVGKSTILLGVLASLSHGQTPCGTVVEEMTSLYISGEDPKSSVLCPRYEAAGGNLENTFFYGANDAAQISFPQFTDPLRTIIRKRNIDICVIDPLFSMLSRKNRKNSEQDVRSVLSGIQAVAEEEKCSIIMVRHLNKKEGQSAIYRGGGSIGLNATARLVFMVGEHPQDSSRSVLTTVLKNIGKNKDSIIFDRKSRSVEGMGKQSVPVMEFEGRCGVTSDDIVSRNKGGRPPKAKNKVKKIIMEELRDGPCKSKRIIDRVEKEGHCYSTVQRACKELPVRSTQKDGEWWKEICHDYKAKTD